MPLMQFSEWITQKYIEWRADKVGRDVSVASFARWIGVKRQNVDGWMKPNGPIPEEQTTIQALVNSFGPEVYQYLNTAPPLESIDPRFQHLRQNWDKLPDWYKQMLERDMEIYEHGESLEEQHPHKGYSTT